MFAAKKLQDDLNKASTPPMTRPTLADDSFSDKAIAQVGICLWSRPGGGITNAAQLLVRPLDVRSDESGGHPGESFVMLTLTREELREMLTALDRDWSEVVSVCGDPNGAPAQAVKENRVP